MYTSEIKFGLTTLLSVLCCVDSWQRHVHVIRGPNASQFILDIKTIKCSRGIQSPNKLDILARTYPIKADTPIKKESVNIFRHPNKLTRITDQDN